MSFPVYATNQLDRSRNLEKYTFTVTWRIEKDFKITQLPYSQGPYNFKNAPFSDFIGLFNLAGSRDPFEGKIYFMDFWYEGTIQGTYADGTKIDDVDDSESWSGYIEPDFGSTVVQLDTPYKSLSTSSAQAVYTFSDIDTFLNGTYTHHINANPWSNRKWLNANIHYVLRWGMSVSAYFPTGLGDVVQAVDRNGDKIVKAINNQSVNVTASVDELKEQQKAYHDEEINGANDMDNQFKGFVNNAESDIKSKWKILWYPIEFTQSLLTVFGGGTQTQAYADKYMFVEGYEYNETTGCLDPIINYSRAINPREGTGAKITFPSYTLPVLNVKLWDSYTFDISSVKEDFPLLFNSLYIAIGILEIYWFVGFLRNKYDDVFGGGD